MTGEYTLELILGEVCSKERKLHILNEYLNRKFRKIIREIEKRIKFYNDIQSAISEKGAPHWELQTYTDRIIGLQEAKAYFNKYLTTKKK